ncbi:hypothetical protein PCC8801_1142 [Rippkaea orientalis PCC 8801]|uniref:Uncharacterized protein n=1 Tax=Rippkaea orientalis (strain PCC 8801 / RF-1) TaxID=41431 RepID=B7K276_RIPO1|nr:hypothetical protein [Rippkaea orientalis]ACK65212.1 hypothetical protein PCC8801_1142 [Rippkaea orientalis PCC 8801]
MTQQTQLNETDSLSKQEDSPLSERLQEIVTVVQSIAFDCNGDTQNLLSLLRTLESLHRQIRCELFEPSLPDTRNTLYELLKDMEETGGWPYIERMKLQKLLENVSTQATPHNEPSEATGRSH